MQNRIVIRQGQRRVNQPTPCFQTFYMFLSVYWLHGYTLILVFRLSPDPAVNDKDGSGSLHSILQAFRSLLVEGSCLSLMCEALWQRRSGRRKEGGRVRRELTRLRALVGPLFSGEAVLAMPRHWRQGSADKRLRGLSGDALSELG